MIRIKKGTLILQKGSLKFQQFYWINMNKYWFRFNWYKLVVIISSLRFNYSFLHIIIILFCFIPTSLHSIMVKYMFYITKAWISNLLVTIVQVGKTKASGSFLTHNHKKIASIKYILFFVGTFAQILIWQGHLKSNHYSLG